MSDVPAQALLHPAVESILRFFTYDHLPIEQQDISSRCCELALRTAHSLPQNAELTAGLRKLLEAKDCFVRASLL